MNGKSDDELKQEILEIISGKCSPSMAEIAQQLSQPVSNENFWRLIKEMEAVGTVRNTRKSDMKF